MDEEKSFHNRITAGIRFQLSKKTVIDKELHADSLCMSLRQASVSSILEVLSDADLVDRIRRLKGGLADRGINLTVNGIDGSGKSTLCKELLDVLATAKIPVARIHVHKWYQHIVRTPCTILLNRLFYRKVFIFDRSYHDNLAVLWSENWRQWLGPAVVVLKHVYPEFDFAIYLRSSFEEIKRRRPEMKRDRYERLSGNYGVITRYSGHIILPSDERSLRAVIDEILAD